MSKTQIPDGYCSALDIYETQTAIGLLKTTFEMKICRLLNLKRVSAPLFVEPSTGLNDDLNGVERPVTFDLKETGKDVQVVHSLAKWKRMALYKYKFSPGEGLYTDMNAIRRDEETDNIHSVYVDQWDWEKVITKADRNIDYLKNTVRLIVRAMYETLNELKASYPTLNTSLEPDVKFITSQELYQMYPDKTPKEREKAVAEKYKTVFLMQIGKKLSNGEPHDGRAPDYDDWDLNGDILLWNDVLQNAFEISSMGIRVNAESLNAQLNESGFNERRKLEFHRMLLADKLPLTIGGGIGQSRLCMFMLGKAHIGEVQVSVWDDNTIKICREKGVELL